MTFYCYHFISRIVGNSEGLLSVGPSSLSLDFPLQTDLFIAEASTQHLLKLWLTCNLYNLLFLSTSSASLYTKMGSTCEHINNVLENGLLESRGELNNPQMRMFGSWKLSAHKCFFSISLLHCTPYDVSQPFAFHLLLQTCLQVGLHRFLFEYL